MDAGRAGIWGRNKFKLGIFGANCASGLAMVNTPGRWDGSWRNNLRLAQLADEAGIECLVPNARWKGFGGVTEVNLHSFETMTWACGLLAHTRRTSVFATVHVPLVNPVFAAKQMVTADHIGEGRFGLNVVCGSNADEFRMFGVPLDAHDTRYEMGHEWLDIVSRIWSGEGPFDFHGKFFDMKEVIGVPGPAGNAPPILMSAGASATGRDFAIRRSDIHYDFCHRPEDSAPRIRETKAMARALGRDIEVWTAAAVVCRPTRREVDDFVAYCIENADWEAIDKRDKVRTAPEVSLSQSPESIAEMRRNEIARTVIGRSHYTMLGGPDRIADELGRLHAAGFDGVALGFVNYVDELPFFAQEVLPRLVHKGLRRE